MRELFQESKPIAVMALVLVLLMVWCIAPVSAVGVQGAKYMGSIAPGGSVNHTMIVSNDADQKPMDIQIDVVGFGQAMDKGYTNLAPANDLSPYSGRKFITLSDTTMHLEPGTSKNVIATIKLPTDVGSGGRYAIISVHAIPKTGAAFTTGVNIPVLITVSGTKPTESGSIQNVDTGKVAIGQPIEVKTTFTNTGNYHYYNTINKVTISDSKGNFIANASTSPSAFAIIPGSTVQYIAKPEIATLGTGTYTVHSGISLDGRVLDEKTTTFEITKPYIPPVTESNITLIPGSPATLKSPDGRYSATFPQGSVLGEVNIVLKPYSQEKLQAAPGGAKLGTTSFEIAGLSGLLSKDATIKVTYSADDLAAAGGDASKLKLAYFDAAQTAWVILPTKVDTASTTLTAPTNHMGVWAVMVSSSTTSSSSAAAGATTTKSPLPLCAILASLVIAVIAAGHNAGKRK
ncbi:MAG: hypothetical protein WC626_12255 [Methanoregula sp.]